jgi:hypothetical protein
MRLFAFSWQSSRKAQGIYFILDCFARERSVAIQVVRQKLSGLPRCTLFRSQ